MLDPLDFAPHDLLDQLRRENPNRELVDVIRGLGSDVREGSGRQWVSSDGLIICGRAGQSLADLCEELSKAD
jgi:hypothetical protein